MPAEWHRYEVLDVFTGTPLEGNALAVFAGGQAIDPALMQQTARELNLSETVFVLPPADPAAEDAALRIFTPAAELPFAGHPVLGSAFVVGRDRGLATVRLRTGSGIVPVRLTRDGDAIVFGEMDQPIPRIEPFADVEALLAALGLEGSELPVELYDNGPRFVYVGLAGAPQLAALRPDLRAIEALGTLGVVCFATDGANVTARMFGPALGVAEDPATGSAAGPLAVHLARHGRTRFGERIEIHQGAVIGRPSVLFASAYGAIGAIERVSVGGAAVFVARGEYLLG